jgi:hypothetical protein
LVPLFEEVGGAIDVMNGIKDNAYETPYISPDARLNIGFLSLFLISLALACNIGDAVYQLRDKLKSSA